MIMIGAGMVMVGMREAAGVSSAVEPPEAMLRLSWRAASTAGSRPPLTSPVDARSGTSPPLPPGGTRNSQLRFQRLATTTRDKPGYRAWWNSLAALPPPGTDLTSV